MDDTKTWQQLLQQRNCKLFLLISKPLTEINFGKVSAPFESQATWCSREMIAQKRKVTFSHDVRPCLKGPCHANLPHFKMLKYVSSHQWKLKNNDEVWILKTKLLHCYHLLLSVVADGKDGDKCIFKNLASIFQSSRTIFKAKPKMYHGLLFL